MGMLHRANKQQQQQPQQRRPQRRIGSSRQQQQHDDVRGAGSAVVGTRPSKSNSIATAVGLFLMVVVLLYFGLAIRYIVFSHLSPPPPTTTTTLGVVDDAAETKKNSHPSAADVTIATAAPPAQPVWGTYVAITATDGEDQNVPPIEVVYGIPPPVDDNARNSDHNNKQDNTIAGVVLLLHACTHDATKFFSPSTPNCPSCVGLAEELQLARLALDQGYMVVAVTSLNRKNGCWGGVKDADRVKTALTECWKRERSSSSLPQPPRRVIAIGASSGGHFAGMLASKGIVDAAVVMVSAVGLANLNQWAAVSTTTTTSTVTTKTVSPPPLYLAPMTRDKATSRRVRQEYEQIKATHPDAPVVLDETSCLPLPVTVDYLYSRVPNLGRAQATAIVQALTTRGHVDPQTLYFVKDPTRSDWRNEVREECGCAESTNTNNSSKHKCCLDGQVLTPGKSPLAKAFHRCWAMHEYCSESVLPAFAYFQKTWASRSRS